jgi:hypothetical protein
VVRVLVTVKFRDGGRQTKRISNNSRTFVAKMHRILASLLACRWVDTNVGTGQDQIPGFE